MSYQFSDNEGRDNPYSLNASRAAIGLPPLHRDVETDVPYSAEEARTLFIYAASVLVLLMACAGLVIWFG